MLYYRFNYRYYSTTQSVSYAYDLLGNTTQMVDENGTTVYTYDRLGNMLTETRGTLSKTYTYDANGNRISAVISDGSFEQSLTYKYDNNNRLTKVTDANGYTNYTYDKNNRILTEKSYNSTKGAVRAYSVYTYYDCGMLKTKKNYRYSSTTSTYLIDDYALTYYADGNIATVTNNDSVTIYIFDNAGRLTSESIDDVVQASYTYDVFGNRATMATPNGTITYTYDKNNRLTAENTLATDGTTSYNYYCYNNTGTLQEKYWGLGLAYYSYDVFDRLTSYSSGGNGASYTYDGNGIRLSKTVNDITTNFINDGGYVVGEVSGDSIIKYTYGNNLISINNNGTIGYYHTDEHGNVSAISDTSRTVVADYDFDAFGNETVSTDTYYNPMRDCGEYYDAETGLIYLRARYYDPSIGRFISEDPIKDGTNWYVYCSNNPIAFVDPSGLFGKNTRLYRGCDNTLDVKRLQERLNELGYYSANGEPLIESGNFNEDTEYAVECYKTDNNLGNIGKDKNVVGKVTWSHLGLTIDNDFEVGFSSSGQMDAEAFYIKASGPNLNNGVSIGGVCAGLVALSGDSKYVGGGIDLVNGEAKGSISMDYVGIDTGGALVDGNIKLKSPPIFGKRITYELTLYLGGFSGGFYFDIKEFKWGAKFAPFVGSGVEWGIE